MLVGCEASHASHEPPPAASPRPLAAAPPHKVFVTGASRCGECHNKMYDEWEVSAHARAATSTAYRAAVTAAGDVTCDRCHAPLAETTARDIVATEGVTCDVCHTLRDPVPAASGGTFRLAIDDMVKYGPRCDLKPHYFHRMGCSPEHAKAEVCGTCHWWEPKQLPVLTEYADWRAGPSSATPCQECHMPGTRAPLAEGSPARDGVPHHGLLGDAADLRRRALALSATVRAAPGSGNATVDVTLTNVAAGHYVPAGLPERRIVIRVAVGGEMQERELGRMLVDAAGTEVPFWRAVKVVRDTRIAPGASWHETFAFAGGGPANIEVIYRPMSATLARELGVELQETPLAKAHVAPGKTVVVKPPPAGKRARP